MNQSDKQTGQLNDYKEEHAYFSPQGCRAVFYAIIIFWSIAFASLSVALFINNADKL